GSPRPRGSRSSRRRRDRERSRASFRTRTPPRASARKTEPSRVNRALRAGAALSGEPNALPPTGCSCDHERVSKLALVTGASRGIGRACALALARDGFEVLVNFRAEEAKAQGVVKAIEQAGGKARAIGFDVRDEKAVNGALEPVLEETPLAALV